MMLLGDLVATIPTIGWNLETLHFRGVDFTIWDTGGCGTVWPRCKHIVDAGATLCWWIDCNDRDRLAESIEEL